MLPGTKQAAQEVSKEIDNLVDKFEGTKLDNVAEVDVSAADDNNTGASTSSDASVNIIVEGVDGAEVKLSRRPSSAELLARVLDAKSDLNLTDKVLVAKSAIRTKHGGAADVYEGTIADTGVKVAVKRLRLNIAGDEQIAKNIAKEIRIWSEFNHANILPILGYCMEGDYPSLVSIWIVDGSLRECMSQGVINTKKDSITMALGIARGLEYIHSRNAIHSDVKSDNVLVSPGKQALLTDFGISRMDTLSAGYTTLSVKGSTRWQAYEFFDIVDDDHPAPKHTVKTDIWAFGMTVYELLTQKLPYNNIPDNNQVILHISRGRVPKQPEFSSSPEDAGIEQFMWSICQNCWEKDPVRRPTMERLESDIRTFSESLSIE